MEEIFNIHIEFAFGENKPVIETCKTSDLEHTIKRLMHGPFATMGGIKSFKVIDSSDFVIFSVSNGKIIFPTKEDVEKSAS